MSVSENINHAYALYKRANLAFSEACNTLEGTRVDRNSALLALAKLVHGTDDLECGVSYSQWIGDTRIDVYVDERQQISISEIPVSRATGG